MTTESILETLYKVDSSVIIIIKNGSITMRSTLTDKESKVPIDKGMRHAIIEGCLELGYMESIQKHRDTQYPSENRKNKAS